MLSPYAALREASTRGCRTVLELALRRRAKHVFYASAMAVFPQYFCDFANGQVIERGEQPDPDLMKSVFPPGVMGYPWTKLVVEQALLSARTAGLPAAIMRLPQLGIAAETGYVRSSDVKVRIAKAAFEAGVMPSGFRLPRTGPADTVSEILTAISLDPRRQQAIYHLCHPAPRTWGPELDEVGLREVSYAEFKRACQAREPRGPLHGYWRLLDRFAGYWFSGRPQARPAERRRARPGEGQRTSPSWPPPRQRWRPRPPRPPRRSPGGRHRKPSCPGRSPRPGPGSDAGTGRRTGVDDLMLALERVQQGNQRGGPLVRRARLDQRLGNLLEYPSPRARVLGGPGADREDAQDPVLRRAEHAVAASRW